MRRCRSVSSPTENPNDYPRTVPLSDDDVAQRLRQIAGAAEDSWMPVNERWSLARMQSKIALGREPATSQWCEADGSVATTHIIKPAGPLPLHALNEVLCLQTLHYLGGPPGQNSRCSMVSRQWSARGGTESSSTATSSGSTRKTYARRCTFIPTISTHPMVDPRHTRSHNS